MEEQENKPIAKKENKLFPLKQNTIMQQMYNENVPEEMKNLKNWVAFKSQPSLTKPGKFEKQLINPNEYGTTTWAKSNDRGTWSTFSQAMDYAIENNCTGIAFALEKKLNICCIDLDGCIGEDKKINSNAKQVLREFGNTYCERSISGKGLHIFCKGTLPKDYIQRNDVIEMYDDTRFISMTGQMLKYSQNNLNDVKNLSEINKKYLGEKKTIAPMRTPVADLGVNEKFIIDKLNNNTKYKSLFAGDTSMFSGDSSRADLSLCMGIAFYSKDINVIDSVFRQSGLYREKWDKGNYGQLTIKKAVEFQKQTYNPKDYYKSYKPQRTARGIEL